MLAQLWPPELQRRHWYLNVIGVVLDQLPVLATSVSPCLAVPAIAGSEVFRGADATAP